ncbi:hypothetical protein AM571_CH04031 [Rhizobium etli 8C-3]|uniref:Uncharacterized protein n=2 Tax=Rhizobium TaxID=379 RepID=A0A4R3QRK0_9HYPH|nr:MULTISPECIES: hypothetical protein [Rhizobium]APO76809.1 hypothetical protein AM571_CH04031 [Rhizobium etli 8C-3]TCU23789.1 hypothetical protein EV130_107144 [Rhizobium azibense]TCU36059.1 hypothetical protein EV129_108146 [Rhizobium azibense]
MEGVLVYLESLSSSAWLRTGVWPFPVVNLIHVFGIALLFGGIVVLDLRLLGLTGKLPVAGLARLVLPIAGTGLCLAVGTGVLMFALNAREYAANPYLPWKLGSILLAGINIAFLHATVWRSRECWEERAPVLAETAAAVSLALWAGTIICGRLMAYF